MTAKGPPSPKTVVRPQPGGRHGADAPLPALARPFVALAARAERDARVDPGRVASELRDVAEAFSRDARARGLAPETVEAAQRALVALVDARVQSNPHLAERAWRAAVRRALPSLQPGAAAVRKLVEAASRRSDAEGRDLARFLEHCLEGIVAAEARRPRSRRRWSAAALIVLFLLAIGAWAGLAEWRFRAELVERMASIDTSIGRDASPAERAAMLDRLRAAAEATAAATPRSPLGLIGRIPALDPARAAEAAYAASAGRASARPLGEALGLALATEGEPAVLYDTLRALSILRGRSPWQAGYVAAWAEARAGSLPELAPLVPHLGALTGPVPDLPAPDPEMLAEARRIAAEAPAADRAFLELERAEAGMALRAWTPVGGVPKLADVLVRASGRSLTDGIPGLYTASGWAWARSAGVGAAVAMAQAEGRALLGLNDLADPDAVLDRLQVRTLDVWEDYLADLRVRPFTDQPSALLVSGTLALRSSPLADLVRAVWREVGGDDRTRAHRDQLRIAAEFGPAIQYVEQGRMAEISQLFAALNVALAALDRRTAPTSRQLMDVKNRAASVVALQQAPTVVVGIIEDVLAQSALATAVDQPETLAIGAGPAGDDGEPGGSPVANTAAAPAAAPVTDLGGDPVFFAEACRTAVDGRYPFADGADADMAAVARLFGPSGPLRTAFDQRYRGDLDTARSPWRWKPQARLAGRDPDSAIFFERAMAIGDALGLAAGPAPSVPFTLEALAQRGGASVALGGAVASVVTSGDAVRYAWPGADPRRGFSVTFGDGGGSRAAPGPWGLMRFLDGLRIRPREGGQRFLIDIRLDRSRVYMQMSFASPFNPVTARALMKGLTCPTRI